MEDQQSEFEKNQHFEAGFKAGYRRGYQRAVEESYPEFLEGEPEHDKDYARIWLQRKINS